ncbi:MULTISPECIES: hypothetical protein [Kordiimonas]|uniref:hypothetical protein n=1 Tax=Kordiimonas TaxID=288021 RepID=UPI001FF52E3C|nr:MULTISPECIES: hypothetical protein [Kordiimonas]MCK0070985.1 hypothetical protein [Kordiimonas laminariae]UTW57730.1 hypothetical protein KFE96_12940 [Kordiimonas sp. SCSIO 12603]
MSDKPLYQGFLGEWILDPDSCEYEQGEPPVTGYYAIHQNGEELEFKMAWVDTEGEQHAHSFRCKPDGHQYKFAGGDLADAISVTATSENTLDSSAFYRDQERMMAYRTLVNGGTEMEVVQKVNLPGGGAPSNFARYVRKH